MEPHLLHPSLLASAVLMKQHRDVHPANEVLASTGTTLRLE